MPGYSKRARRRSPLQVVAIVAAALALVSPSFASSHDSHHRHHAKHPSSNEAGAALDLLDAASQASNQSLLWGTYRPNLYFGMRPRVPKSLIMGLVWWGALDPQGYSKARHACDQADDFKGYAWAKHDGRTSGSQYIRDFDNNVNLTTDFLKVPGGEHGGSWAVRIRGEAIDFRSPMRVTLAPYFGLEGLGTLDLYNAEDEEGLEGDVKIEGSTPQLGDFRIRLEQGANNRPLTKGPHADDFGEALERTSFLGVQIPPTLIWKAKEYILTVMGPRIQKLLDTYPRDDFPDPAIAFSLPNEVRYGSNLFAFARTFETSFEYTIFFDSLASTSSAPASQTRLDKHSLEVGLEAAFDAFDRRFARLFPQITDGNEFEPFKISFAKELLSSTIGGIGYFHGTSLVDRDFAHEYDDDYAKEMGGKDPNPQQTPEKELFTATPSRPFFPRGFYWDEGFHLVLIGAWDNDLSLEILKSWINLIDDDGWVAREQILGDEARSKVPKEFQVQYPTYANPPTLAMAVTAYIGRLKQKGTSFNDADLGVSSDRSPLASLASTADAEALSDRFVNDPALAKAFLSSLYPKLRRHYEWFRETQRGQIREWGRQATDRTEAYRWRGRTADHVLTSGMDDYPRAKPPHEGELHLDLISWMAFFTRTMKEIAEFVGEDDDAAEYRKTYDAILANIEDLHWNEDKEMYCDVSVDENDESYHVCHKGYISIFPFLLGLLPPDSPHLDAILEDVQNPEHLWSSYGIRSLAKSDDFFGQGENYWRGPVWIPINYMALKSLHNKYAKEDGPYRKKAKRIYSELRENLIDNTFWEWQKTGFAWEQYDSTDGHGQRSRPFTGWTSMITLIMAEQYP